MVFLCQLRFSQNQSKRKAVMKLEIIVSEAKELIKGIQEQSEHNILCRFQHLDTINDVLSVNWSKKSPSD